MRRHDWKMKVVFFFLSALISAFIPNFFAFYLIKLHAFAFSAHQNIFFFLSQQTALFLELY